jgi:hypothetical protein
MRRFKVLAITGVLMMATSAYADNSLTITIKNNDFLGIGQSGINSSQEKDNTDLKSPQTPPVLNKGKKVLKKSCRPRRSCPEKRKACDCGIRTGLSFIGEGALKAPLLYFPFSFSNLAFTSFNSSSNLFALFLYTSAPAANPITAASRIKSTSILNHLLST